MRSRSYRGLVIAFSILSFCIPSWSHTELGCYPMFEAHKGHRSFRLTDFLNGTTSFYLGQGIRGKVYRVSSSEHGWYLEKKYFRADNHAHDLYLLKWLAPHLSEIGAPGFQAPQILKINRRSILFKDIVGQTVSDVLNDSTLDLEFRQSIADRYNLAILALKNFLDERHLIENVQLDFGYLVMTGRQSTLLRPRSPIEKDLSTRTLFAVARNKWFTKEQSNNHFRESRIFEHLIIDITAQSVIVNPAPPHDMVLFDPN